MSDYLREKLIELEDRIDGRIINPSESRPAFLGQVIDGGSMPTDPNKFFLVNPVTVGGEEEEGGSASLTADTTRKIPIVVTGAVPDVGDYLIVRQTSNRWVAEKPNPLNQCNPRYAGCPGLRYSANGTVDDAINGTQPIVYDYVTGSWYSSWLPFSTSYVALTGPGSNPCIAGSGNSYYFYRLTPQTSTVKAEIFFAGEFCTLAGPTPTFLFYNYTSGGGFTYPDLLGNPIGTLINGQYLESTGDKSGCDPLAYSASWDAGSLYSHIPLTSADFEIPKFTPPAYGFTCAKPCPLPRRDLTVSWVNIGGNGSDTLVWDSTAKDWKLDCSNGLQIRLSWNGTTYGFRATLRGNPDCTGSTAVYDFPTFLALSSFTCEPFELIFGVVGTSSGLYTAGYRSFTVTL